MGSTLPSPTLKLVPVDFTVELAPFEADCVHCVLQLQVLDVLNVNDKKFSVALSMYFGVHWKEDRLILPSEGHNNSGAEWVPIDLDFMQYLWVPNVFVYDIAEFHAIECLKRLAGIWVVKDKELFYNQVSSVVPITDRCGGTCISSTCQILGQY